MGGEVIDGMCRTCGGLHASAPLCVCCVSCVSSFLACALLGNSGWIYQGGCSSSCGIPWILVFALEFRVGGSLLDDNFDVQRLESVEACC